jgi:hypothetical protein
MPILSRAFPLLLVPALALVACSSAAPEEGAALTTESAFSEAPLSLGGSTVLDPSVFARLHLAANARVRLTGVQENAPVTGGASFWLRPRDATDNSYVGDSASGELYFQNGPIARDVLVKVILGEVTAGGMFRVRVSARSTRCDRTCNDPRTSVCDEATGTCMPCASSYGAPGGARACRAQWGVCAMGSCSPCNGDDGSGSSRACPTALPHCDSQLFGYGAGCRAFAPGVDFAPPPALANRETAVTLACTMQGVALPALQASVVLGPRFLEPTEDAQMSYRPQAYVRGMVAPATWSRRAASTLSDLLDACGPSRFPVSLWTPRGTPAPVSADLLVAKSGSDTCRYHVIGDHVELTFASEPLVCHGLVASK